MAYSCCSANFSSRSQRSCLPSSGSSCASPYPSNLVYTTTSCSPSTCQLGSSFSSGCQETCIEPNSRQRSCVVPSPCQTACYYPRSFTPCSPCQGPSAGCLGLGSSSCRSLGYGSRSCYSGGCGSSGFRSLNYSFPTRYYRSTVCSPICVPSRGFYSSCYQPIYTSGFC
ncbi:keratin-associated protein 13-1 [Cricetulus griseus]|uniref:Keratin-associated protein n=1 Tax=Cricetulus griseus TaxID=10029 RepID=G3GT15_CRIGR|nr:keratin-associated protein 13-1 [Cricetulus griseus]EGW01444.1 Keratin-associated protein 13-3 [Cricetulus griseus]